jgi:hypothetical protein
MKKQTDMSKTPHTRLFPKVLAGTSIVGVLATAGAFLAFLVRTEIPMAVGISAASIVLSFIAGLWSKKLSDNVRKLSFSPRVFLSYQSQLEDPVRSIAERLRAGGAKIWIDTEQIKAGDLLLPAISKAIDDADTVLVFLSHRSSPNLDAELKIALEKKKRIVPVLMEKTDVPISLRGLRYIDLTGNTQKGMNELIEAATSGSYGPAAAATA